MSRSIDVLVPDIGDYADIPVIEVLVRLGERIEADTAIVTLESDKATMDVPSGNAGIVQEILVKLGDRVSCGSPILRLNGDTGAADEVVAATPAIGNAPNTARRPASMSAPPASTASLDLPPNLPSGANAFRCGPSVRKLARELGVDLAQLRGSGPKGRLFKEDVIAHVSQAMRAPPVAARTSIGGFDLPPWPRVEFEKFGPIERRPRSRIQKVSAANLARNWVMIPHVTNFDEADITGLDDFRKQINAEQRKDGIKLTLLAFLIKAAVHNLKTFPDFNSSLDGDDVVQKNYWHIGFAADTPNGLVVPVIRDADRKGVLEIAVETAQLAALAREGKLKPEQMQGGCFTVSSLGGIGGTGFTPIINAPEIAILGVTRASTKPVWDGSQFQPRLILPLCLSWDHRALDGVAAARFNVHFASTLADFRRVLL